MKNFSIALNPKISWFLLFFGLFMGFSLATVLIWAGLEADFYGFTRLGDERLTLNCPRLMTIADRAVVRAVVTNPTERTIEPLMRADISSRGEWRSERQTVQILSGKTSTVEWQVSSSDVDMGNFIFARVYRYPVYQMPTAQQTCGVLVLPIPLPIGELLLVLWMMLALVCTPLGLFMVQQHLPIGDPRSERLLSALQLQSALVILALLLGYMGYWGFGLLALTVAVLVAASLLTFFRFPSASIP